MSILCLFLLSAATCLQLNVPGTVKLTDSVEEELAVYDGLYIQVDTSGNDNTQQYFVQLAATIGSSHPRRETRSVRLDGQSYGYWMWSRGIEDQVEEMSIHLAFSLCEGTGADCEPVQALPTSAVALSVVLVDDMHISLVELMNNPTQSSYVLPHRIKDIGATKLGYFNLDTANINAMGSNQDKFSVLKASLRAPSISNDVCQGSVILHVYVGGIPTYVPQEEAMKCDSLTLPLNPEQDDHSVTYICSQRDLQMPLDSMTSLDMNVQWDERDAVSSETSTAGTIWVVAQLEESVCSGLEMSLLLYLPLLAFEPYLIRLGAGDSTTTPLYQFSVEIPDEYFSSVSEDRQPREQYNNDEYSMPEMMQLCVIPCTDENDCKEVLEHIPETWMIDGELLRYAWDGTATINYNLAYTSFYTYELDYNALRIKGKDTTVCINTHVHTKINMKNKSRDGIEALTLALSVDLTNAKALSGESVDYGFVVYLYSASEVVQHVPLSKADELNFENLTSNMFSESVTENFMSGRVPTEFFVSCLTDSTFVPTSIYEACEANPSDTTDPNACACACCSILIVPDLDPYFEEPIKVDNENMTDSSFFNFNYAVDSCNTHIEDDFHPQCYTLDQGFIGISGIYLSHKKTALSVRNISSDVPVPDQVRMIASTASFNFIGIDYKQFGAILTAESKGKTTVKESDAFVPPSSSSLMISSSYGEKIRVSSCGASRYFCISASKVEPCVLSSTVVTQLKEEKGDVCLRLSNHTIVCNVSSNESRDIDLSYIMVPQEGIDVSVFQAVSEGDETDLSDIMKNSLWIETLHNGKPMSSVVRDPTIHVKVGKVTAESAELELRWAAAEPYKTDKETFNNDITYEVHLIHDSLDLPNWCTWKQYSEIHTVNCDSSECSFTVTVMPNPIHFTVFAVDRSTQTVSQYDVMNISEFHMPTPWWVWLLLALCIMLVILAIVGIVICVNNRKKKNFAFNVLKIEAERMKHVESTLSTNYESEEF